MRIVTSSASSRATAIYGEPWPSGSVPVKPPSDDLIWPLPGLGRSDAPRERDHPRHRLLRVGEGFFSIDPAQITTYVDSGVAVCMWDPATHVGGLQHFLLPPLDDGERPQSSLDSCEVDNLLEGLLDLGCRPDNLQARVFGGATRAEGRTIENLGHMRRPQNRSAQEAMAYLEAEGIPVISSDIRGQRLRKVTFWTDQGMATVAIL